MITKIIFLSKESIHEQVTAGVYKLLIECVTVSCHFHFLSVFLSISKFSGLIKKAVMV